MSEMEAGGKRCVRRSGSKSPVNPIGLRNVPVRLGSFGIVGFNCINELRQSALLGAS